MAIGTDREIVKKREKTTTRNGFGRPRKNRDLALLLFKAGKSNAQVAKAIKCTPKTAGVIRQELIKAGKLEAPERRKTVDDIVEADFDEECERAKGYKFSEYLQSKRKAWRRPFNFCLDAWESIWDRPSMVIAADRTSRLGMQLAMSWLKVYGEDTKRLRGRKKLIRTLFAFLDREDVNNKHLTMPTSKNPRNVKKIPEVSMTVFVDQFIAAMDEFEVRYPGKSATWMRTKLVLLARTGNYKEERGLKGLSRDTTKKSYLIFSGDSYRGQVFEKFGETWIINWIPERMKDELRQLAKIEDGENYFKFSGRFFTEITGAWRDIVGKHTGIEDFDWHAIRKVSITWFYVLGIPLEVATMINVGWKDLNVARDHYLNLRAMMKRSEREAYAAKIPAWFKEGLEEYMVEGTQLVGGPVARRGGR